MNIGNYYCIRCGKPLGIFDCKFCLECHIKNKEEQKERLKNIFKDNLSLFENMTNGDIIKMMFPNAKYTENFADVEMKVFENDTRFCSIFDRDWYDAPYKEEGAE